MSLEDKDLRVYLAHILDCATRIEDYIRDGEAPFMRDTKTQDAVSIPWSLMAGFRDVLIHNYEGVDLQRVWSIATEDLPAVKSAIAALLPPLEQLERELAGEDEN